MEQAEAANMQARAGGLAASTPTMQAPKRRSLPETQRAAGALAPKRAHDTTTGAATATAALVSQGGGVGDGNRHAAVAASTTAESAAALDKARRREAAAAAAQAAAELQVRLAEEQARQAEAEAVVSELESDIAAFKSKLSTAEARLADTARERQARARLRNKAHRLQTAIAKKDVPKAYKNYAAGMANTLANAKRLAIECQREVRRRLVRPSVRVERDAPRRARRLMGEMIMYWKRNEKSERERRKKAEREMEDRRRKEEEEREAKRQQRKFNYLITQTELYAHFMRHKTDEGKDAAGAGGGAESILTKLDETPDPEADGEAAEGGDDLKRRALAQAQSAVAAAQRRTQQFDSQRRDKAAAAAAKGLTSQEEFDGAYSLANPNMQGMQEVEQPKMLRATLKEYQLKGLRWLSNLYQQGINGILADEMGLGKTIQSIATIAHLAEREDIWGPFLVVTPASTLHNWCSELQRFTPELRVIPYWGTVAERKVIRTYWNDSRMYTRDADFHVMVTSYDMVVRDAKYIGRVKWQYMILDEAQAIKSSASHRWNILLKFNCRNRLLLTGTPIQNTMAELWALLHFIMPTLFDSHDEFNEWFSKDIESHAQDTSSKLDHAQLSRLHMILQPFMLRRIKTNVEHELADKVEVQINCHMTPRQQRLYRRLRQNLKIEQLVVNEGSRSKSTADKLMNLVMQFRKICNHPNLLNRRPIRSPFFCEAPRRSEAPDVYASLLEAYYSTSSALELTLPRLLFEEVRGRHLGTAVCVPWGERGA